MTKETLELSCVPGQEVLTEIGRAFYPTAVETNLSRQAYFLRINHNSMHKGNLTK